MLEVTKDNIDKALADSKDRTVVLFYADWCPFCRKFKPQFEAYEGKAGVALAEAKINEEENPLWDRYKIDVIPTIVAFRYGKEIARRNGKAGIGLFDDDVKALIKQVSASPQPK